MTSVDGIRDSIGRPPFICEIWNKLYNYGGGSGGGTAKRVYLSSFHIPRPCTIDEIIFYCATLSAANNFRVALYGEAVTKGSPAGAALKGESGNISGAATGALIYTPATPIPLDKGEAWGAIQVSDAVLRFARAGSTTAMWGGSTHPMLDGCYYDLGAFGAFTDPCPAVTADGGSRVTMLLRPLKWG
jgi:hypothetical protein